ncbi:unnamed protein product [Camellia sinensis]
MKGILSSPIKLCDTIPPTWKKTNLVSANTGNLMADNGRTSLSLDHHTGGRSFSGWINLAFISMRIYLLQEHNVRHIYRHAVLEFLVPVTIDFVKLQCQGKSVSPFETHPKTMWVAITSLLMCCLAYDSEVRLSRTRPTYAQVVLHGTVFFGWLCSVSLASILFSDSVGLVLYSLYILFLAAELRV